MAPARATAAHPPASDARWTAAQLTSAVAARGFVLIGAPAMRGLMGDRLSPAEAATFARSWDDLPRDDYMADGGRYRRRRHAVYVAAGGALTRQPDQPHYQSLAHNPLNGGIARWFAPVRAEVGESPILRAAIDLLVSVAGVLRGPTARWRVEVHQFRIEARAGEAGRPTPEGMHRDGVDFVLVMLIGRQNAAQGVSTVADPAGRPLATFQLSQPFDAMILDDAQVRHGVSLLEPADRARPATRDALVVTLKALDVDPGPARGPAG
jgi:hypothetical protein